jgi:hypothetical protein
MAIAIQYVDTTNVSQVWPLVEPFLAEALESGPEFPDWSHNYNIHHLQMFLTNGAWLLVVAIEEDGSVSGACTVSFVNYPIHRVAFVTAIGGKLISNTDTFNQFKLLLKQRGATKIQGYGRESIMRLWKRYDFEPRLTLVEVLI